MFGYQYYLQIAELFHDDRAQVFEHGVANFGAATALELEQKFDSCLESIKENPYQYPNTSRGKIYSHRGKQCLVIGSPYFILFEINNHEINILRILNTRQKI
jgi:plasmid stabilization system protein ParE